ncbi:MAG: FecR domain-containing protein [Opitutaceae bacterium]|nr:FecR domain-containing protein [Opitutaceae bacterium]
MKATPPHPFSRDEAVEATAAAWLAQRDDGLTPQEEAEFARWRQADPRHEAAVARLEATWRTLLQLQSFRPEARRHPDRDLLARPRQRKAIPFPVVAAGMGLAAAVALVAVWWWPRTEPRPDVEPATQRYATTAGGYQRLTLADGSLVELNASSEVNVQYTPAERRVRLVCGEANFSVAKNKERPFLVQAGPVTVCAVGTAFDVRLDTSKIEVLVTEGKVQVNNGAARSATAPVMEPALLVAGQRAVISMPSPTAISTPVVEQLTADAIREELAWQGPRLVFVETPLAEVVGQFNRLNQVQIELGDPALGSLPVGGSFRPENVEAFVRLLAQDQGIVVERPDADHIILRKAK